MRGSPLLGRSGRAPSPHIQKPNAQDEHLREATKRLQMRLREIQDVLSRTRGGKELHEDPFKVSKINCYLCLSLGKVALLSAPLSKVQRRSQTKSCHSPM